MLLPLWKKCLMVAALAVAGMTLSPGSAQAGWGHWRAAYGGWYAYGAYPYVYTTSYCSPCGVAGYGWYGWNARWSSCWSPCYSPCYSSCCGPVFGSYYGVTSSCCGGGVVVGENAAVVPQAAPAPTPAPAPAPSGAQEPASVLPSPPAPKAVPPAPDVDLPKLPEDPLPPAPGGAPKPTASYRAPQDGTLLSVVVPQDAKVYVNGVLTKTPGTHRQFVSSGLLPGYRYTYEVRAVVTRNGEQVSDTQVVRVRVGETRDLAFDLAARPAAVIAASLP